MNPDVIPVDFNNCDEDGAVRLNTRGTLEHLTSHRITLSEGLPITVTDGEITATGRVTFREGMWAALIERWSYLDSDDA
jgi:hypothetical protein